MVVKETEYKGILFRSRLEARVAFFFDKAGIEWVYEPDRVVNGDSEYNPDFYLPRDDVYVEVKGKRPGYEKEVAKIIDFISADSPIKTVVIISEIPDPTPPGLPHFPCYHLVTSKGESEVIAKWFYFCDDNHGGVEGHVSSEHGCPPIYPFNSYFDISPKTDYELTEFKRKNEPLWLRESMEELYSVFWKRDNKLTFKAYAAARKADFTMRRAG